MGRCCTLRHLATAVAAVAAVALAVAAAPSAGGASRSKCERLKGHDIAPARSVKLVQRPNHDDGTDLLGCVLPRGPVQLVASSADFSTTVDSYSIRQIAGRVLLIEYSESSQYRYSNSLAVYHLRTRRAYAIAGLCEGIAGDDCSSGTASRAPAAFVTPKGRAVAVVVRGAVATVTAFNTRGTPRALDSAAGTAIDPASLRLDGNVASWTNAGVAHSASIVPG